MQEEIRIIDPAIAESFFERFRLYLDIGLHLVLLAAALSPFVILYRNRKTPVSRRDLYWLIGAMIALPTAAVYSAQFLPPYAVPFVRGYTVLCFVVLLISMFIVTWRLQQQSTGSYALTILCSLVLLGFLMGLMLPAVPTAREAARRMSCSNNLKSLALAIHNSKEGGKDLFNPQTSNSPEVAGGPDVSWRVKVLPYLEQQALKDRYHSDQTWESETNWELAQERLSAYTCPSEPRHMNIKGGRYTSYAMLNNSNRNESNPNLVAAKRDGKLIPGRVMLIESCGANVIWTEPRDVDLDTSNWAIKPENEAVKRTPWNSRNVGSSFHAGGTQAAMADGSIRFLSETIDPEVLRQLILGGAVNEETDY